MKTHEQELRKLLLEAATYLEERDPDPQHRPDESADLLERIHNMEMKRRDDDDYQSMESWLEDVRRANICDLSA